MNSPLIPTSRRAVAVASRRPPYNVVSTAPPAPPAPGALGWVAVAAKGIAILASTGMFFNWLSDYAKIDYRSEIKKIKAKANCQRCADESDCYSFYGCATGTGWLPGSNSDRYYSDLVVQDIVNVYINQCLEVPTFPEYDKANGHIRHSVVDYVHSITGYEKKHVSYVLDAIHDLVGRAELTNMFLFPRTAWANKSKFTTPEKLESVLAQYEQQRDPTVFERVADVTNTLLGVVVIGAVLAGGVYVYDLYKKVSG